MRERLWPPLFFFLSHANALCALLVNAPLHGFLGPPSAFGWGFLSVENIPPYHTRPPQLNDLLTDSFWKGNLLNAWTSGHRHFPQVISSTMSTHLFRFCQLPLCWIWQVPEREVARQVLCVTCQGLKAPASLKDCIHSNVHGIGEVEVTLWCRHSSVDTSSSLVTLSPGGGFSWTNAVKCHQDPKGGDQDHCRPTSSGF